MDKPLWGLRVQAPFGARVLSFVCCAPNDGFGPQSGLVQRVVLYAAAWGSENRPTGLRSGGRRLAVRTAMDHHIGAMPRTPFPASRDFPSRGNERYEGKNSESYTSGTISAFSPFGGWRHHLSPASGGTIIRAYCRAIYEENVSRCFILSPGWGKVRRSRIRGSRVAANHQNAYYVI